MPRNTDAAGDAPGTRSNAFFRTIAVAAHKGGVGKTTTAMALAAALAKHAGGAAVTLVDLDPQGHSTLGLGLELGEDADRTTLDVFLEREAVPIRELLQPVPHVPNLTIVPATIRLELAAARLYGRAMRHAVLRDAIDESVLEREEWFVLDCPPSLGPLVENALFAADLVIVPCRMEARATDGLADLLDVLRVLRGRTFDEWRILRTVVDPRKSTTNAAIEAALRSRYTGYVLRTVIPVSEPLNKAQIERRDIFSYAPTSSGAEAYTALLEEVLELWAAAANARA